MLPNIDKSIRISINQSVSSSGMLYCNLGTRCVMCSVVDNGVFEAHRGAPPICVWMDAMLAGSVHGGAVPVSAAFGLELEFF